jgi:hypothetical protein
MIIGVVGPHDLVPVVAEVARRETDIEAHEVPYDHESDAPELVAAHSSAVDAWLFTGVVPYRITMDTLTRPARFVDYSGMPLLEALLRSVRATPDLDRVSIDTLDEKETSETLLAAGFAPDAVEVRPFRQRKDALTFQEFHRTFAAKDQERTIALTCLASVHAGLETLGVRSVRLVPTRQSILSAVRLLAFQAASSLDADAGIVIAEVTSTAPASAHTKVMARLAERLAGIVTSFPESSQDVIVTTRGPLLQTTAQLSHFNELEMFTDYRVHVGFGWGGTSAECLQLARRALVRASAYTESRAVVATRSSSVVLEGTTTAHAPAPAAESLTTIARRTGLSAATIRRVRSAAAQIEPPLTTQTLADALAVEPRTARRWLSSLENGGYARKTGSLHDGLAGRPFATYDLLL